MSGMRQSAAVSTGRGINAAICDAAGPRAKPSAASCRTQARGSGREYSCDSYILCRYGHVAQVC